MAARDEPTPVESPHTPPVDEATEVTARRGGPRPAGVPFAEERELPDLRDDLGHYFSPDSKYVYLAPPPRRDSHPSEFVIWRRNYRVATSSYNRWYYPDEASPEQYGRALLEAESLAHRRDTAVTAPKRQASRPPQGEWVQSWTWVPHTWEDWQPSSWSWNQGDSWSWESRPSWGEDRPANRPRREGSTFVPPPVDLSDWPPNLANRASSPFLKPERSAFLSPES